jgi:hypothetical protein
LESDHYQTSFNIFCLEERCSSHQKECLKRKEIEGNMERQRKRKEYIYFRMKKGKDKKINKEARKRGFQ